MGKRNYANFVLALLVIVGLFGIDLNIVYANNFRSISSVNPGLMSERNFQNSDEV